MERLTKYLASGAADYNYPADCYGGNDCNDRVTKSAYRQTCVEHLAAYEDTGLTPEEVSALVKDWSDRCTIVGECSGIDRMRELAEADKDGRVVVLPCRQEDELWTYCNHPVKRVYSFTVSDVSTLNGRTVLNTLGLGTIRPEDVGKTVFRTSEDAEKALAEREGKA